MTHRVHFEHAPPRSWEHFEELCTDIFQSRWRDPALVRHGRAGQRQNGVDIVARNGGIFPVGLQCKKLSRWPVSKLTKKQIDAEVEEALCFKPVLKVFYILTTAPDDANLLDHVRKINEQHEKMGLFEVVLLGWHEIVRRAILDRQVADKHFGLSGGGAPRSPLLATWFMSKGKFEKSGAELELSVRELAQDFRDWPTGHVVVRQRESDILLEKLWDYEHANLPEAKRRERINLRDELRILTRAEKKSTCGVRLMLGEDDVSSWLFEVWDGVGVPLAIEYFLNGHIGQTTEPSKKSGFFIRMSPPGDPNQRCSTSLTPQDLLEINKVKEWRQDKFSNPLTQTVSELPSRVRACVAIPRIVRAILEFRTEYRLSWDQVRQMKALDIGDWTISIG